MASLCALDDVSDPATKSAIERLGEQVFDAWTSFDIFFNATIFQMYGMTKRC